jgi:hypothetical protein
MRRRENGTYDIREAIEPTRTEDAQPEDVNEIIDMFLGKDIELRNEYRNWTPVAKRPSPNTGPSAANAAGASSRPIFRRESLRVG